jgi:dienelactone hydrolase
MVISRYADELARNGLYVVMPDIYDNDPQPQFVFTKPVPFDSISWGVKHNQARVEKIIEQSLAGMRTELGAKKIGSVGFCFGARYTVRFMAEGKGIDAAFVAHPTALEDSETNATVGPLSIAGAGKSFPYLQLYRR